MYVWGEDNIFLPILISISFFSFHIYHHSILASPVAKLSWAQQFAESGLSRDGLLLEYPHHAAVAEEGWKREANGCGADARAGAKLGHHGGRQGRQEENAKGMVYEIFQSNGRHWRRTFRRCFTGNHGTGQELRWIPSQVNKFKQVIFNHWQMCDICQLMSSRRMFLIW